MELMNSICKLAPHCKHAGKEGICNALCSPFMLLHGEGNSGLWKATNVPPKYRNSTFETLPIQKDNNVAYAFLKTYRGNILENVRNGIGLFFYSIPNAENRLGTGTGKTTSAVALLHAYLLERVKEDSTGGQKIEQNPALFYKASELQTLYNAQFRGTQDMQDKASLRYYKIKRLLMTAELVVLDDIGIRQKITDAFENELTEIIDARDSKVLMTIYTSNLPIEKLADTLGDRIASRIEGMTETVAFVGKDHRRGGVLK
jgi:DNA replication protein DnaC